MWSPRCCCSPWDKRGGGAVDNTHGQRWLVCTQHMLTISKRGEKSQGCASLVVSCNSLQRRMPWTFRVHDNHSQDTQPPIPLTTSLARDGSWAVKALTCGLCVSQSMAWTAAEKCPPLCRCWCVGSDRALPLLLVPDDPPEVSQHQIACECKVSFVQV